MERISNLNYSHFKFCIQGLKPFRIDPPEGIVKDVKTNKDRRSWPEVFIPQNSQENTCASLIFIKKETPAHVFPLNFAKF